MSRSSAAAPNLASAWAGAEPTRFRGAEEGKRYPSDQRQLEYELRVHLQPLWSSTSQFHREVE
jgi:hypothetical protein